MSREYSRNVSSADRAALEEQLLTDSMTRKAYHGVEIARGLEQDAYNKERRDAETAALNYKLETDKKRDEAKTNANLSFNSPPKETETIADTVRNIEWTRNQALASGVPQKDVDELLVSSTNSQLVGIYRDAEKTATSVGLSFKDALEKSTSTLDPIKKSALTHQEQVAYVASYAGDIQSTLKSIPKSTINIRTMRGETPQQIITNVERQKELDDIEKSITEDGGKFVKKQGSTYGNYYDLRSKHVIAGSANEVDVDAFTADLNDNFEIEFGGKKKQVADVIKEVKVAKKVAAVAEPMKKEADKEIAEADAKVKAAEAKSTVILEKLVKASTDSKGIAKEESASADKLIEKLTADQAVVEKDLTTARRNLARAYDYSGATTQGLRDTEATGDFTKVSEAKFAINEERKLIGAVEELATRYKADGGAPANQKEIEDSLLEIARKRGVNPEIVGNYIGLMRNGAKENTSTVKSWLTHIDNLASVAKKKTK